MRLLFIGAITYVLLVATASLIDLSFADFRVNICVVVAAWIAGALILVAGVNRLAARMVFRPWIGRTVTAVAALPLVSLAIIVGFISAFEIPPDFKNHGNGLTCRSSIYGNATVATKDELLVVSIFQPIGTVLERRLGTHKRKVYLTPFVSFEDECAHFMATFGT